MRDFEDVDGDCNESQPRDDDEDYELWDLDDIDTQDSEPDSVEPEDFPF